MTTCSDDSNAAGKSPQQLMKSARDLLIQALNLMDRAEAPGHLGARLQHVIDDLAA
jgi:hypothetical protein